MTLSINIIGAGKLGKTLGYLWHQHQIGPIIGVYNTDKNRAQEAIQYMGDGRYIEHIQSMPYANITFITTPDAAISHACELFSQHSAIQSNDFVVHCSGALSSDILKAAQDRGYLTASIHPMRSFAQNLSNKDNFAGTYCAMEGDTAALLILERVFKIMGAIPYVIQKDKKVFYHASGVFASNYLVTLMAQSIECLKQAEIEEELAKKISLSIMMNTLNNLNHQDLQRALTGPLQRGDIATIQSHLEHLKQQRNLYQALGMATLPLTTLDEASLEQLKQLFQSYR